MAGTSSDRHHHLPAVVIGGFSFDTTRRRRDRPVWVRRAGRDSPFPRAAADLAWKRGLYTIEHPNLLANVVELSTGNVYVIPAIHAEDIENGWEYERHLRQDVAALRYIETGPVDALSWLRIAMYISDLFTRGPDWEGRYQSRMEPVLAARSETTDGWPTEYGQVLGDKHFDRDSANFARLIERRRIFPSVIAASWMIRRAAPGSRFVVSDRGYTLVMNERQKWAGYAVPLAPDLAVVLAAVDLPTQLSWDGSRWLVKDITNYTVPVPEVDGMNRAMWNFAHDEIYGRDEKDVLLASREARGDTRGHDPLLERAALLGLTPETRRANEDIVGRLSGMFRMPRSSPMTVPVWDMFAWPDGPPRPARNRARSEMPRRGRNEPCYCGSGNKFKRCCGKPR